MPDCIESLLAQSHIHWEALIVNDGSTDATSEVVRLYASKDDRITLIEKENGGLSSARNAGIKIAKGTHFIFLDSDDFLYDNCLEQIALLLVDSTEKKIIQSGYTYITEDKDRILSQVKIYQKKSLFPEIFNGNLGPCHSLCISAKLVENIGFFDETLKSVEDWDFWMRAIKAGGYVTTISDPLVYYRYSKNSMSRNPFVLYDALKIVISRGPKKDSRISIESPLNRDYDFDIKPVLKNVLLRSIGLGVMQGEIDTTLAFFKKETLQPIENYTSKDFELMCSYLSFRYWYSRSDIHHVFSVIYPNFILFFKAAGYDSYFTKRALYFIFKRHIFYKNIYTYGKTAGSLVNFVVRNFNEKLLIHS